MVRKLRWTEDAAADLSEIADYLFERTPERAEGILRTIYEAPTRLLDFPLCGRPGMKNGTRELVLAPLPYIVVYRVTEPVIHIVRIVHGARNWN